MKTTLRVGIILGGLLIQAVSFADGKHTITPKFGQYSLDSTTQIIASSTSIFEESSGSAGVEYQYRITENMTIGGSIDSFSHNYTRLGINGTMDTAFVLFNFKYIFSVSDWFNPYIGASAGVAAIDMSGSVSGTAADTAAGISLGIAFPINDTIGLGIEYRKFSATVTGDVSGGGTTDIDASGSVFTANLNITF